MAIGTLYLDITKRTFFPIGTLLGPMCVVPFPNTVVRKGPFEVSLSQEMAGLSTPVKYYDVLVNDGHTVSSTRKVGRGFIGPVQPEVLGFGLIYRYSRRSGAAPDLIYRTADLCVYHSANYATVITLPETIPEIEDLLLAI